MSSSLDRRLTALERAPGERLVLRVFATVAEADANAELVARQERRYSASSQAFLARRTRHEGD